MGPHYAERYEPPEQPMYCFPVWLTVKFVAVESWYHGYQFRESWYHRLIS